MAEKIVLPDLVDPAANAGGKVETLSAFFDSNRKLIATLLPKMMLETGAVERVINIAMTSISRNPDLMRCTRDSVLGAVLQCVILGLEPNTPLKQAYLVPFANNKLGTMECALILGYSGLLELIYNSGKVKSIRVEAVYKGDSFAYAFGTEEFLKHARGDGSSGEITHFYAYASMTDGGFLFEVWTVERMKRHGERFTKTSTADTPWRTDFEAMGKKTILKQLANILPKSIADRRVVTLGDVVVSKVRGGTVESEEISDE